MKYFVMLGITYIYLNLPDIKVTELTGEEFVSILKLRQLQKETDNLLQKLQGSNVQLRNNDNGWLLQLARKFRKK